MKVWHDLTGREGRHKHSQAEISLFRGMEECNCPYAGVHVKAPEELQLGIPLERQVQAGIGRTLTPRKSFDPILEAGGARGGSPEGSNRTSWPLHGGGRCGKETDRGGVEMAQVGDGEVWTLPTAMRLLKKAADFFLSPLLRHHYYLWSHLSMY